MRVDETGDWELEDFTRAHLDGEIEILMHENGNRALVVWPWWADPEAVNGAAWIAESMGFDDILELGNMVGYSIPEVDCSDWDFMLVGVAA